MENAVIQGLAKTSQQSSGGDLNSFKGQSDEILPSNLERNYSGFLVRKDAIKFKVNIEKLLARIALLKEQLLIGKFIKSKPPPQAMRLWIQTVNQELRGSALTFCRNVGERILPLKW